MRAILGLLAVLLLWLPARLLRLWLDRRRARQRAVVTFDLAGALVEEDQPPRPLGGGRGPRASLQYLLNQLEAAGEDPAVEAVAFRLGSLQAGWALLDELREAVLALRRSGRGTFVWLERPGHAEYFLASAFEHVAVAPLATLDLVGLRAEVTFWKGALDLLGITAHFEAAGEFKSFGEPFTREGMSPEFRESLDAVLSAVHAQFRAAVADSRTLAPEAVQALFDRGPFTAAEAKELGLVDEVCYADAWRRSVRSALGGPDARPGDDPEDLPPPPPRKDAAVAPEPVAAARAASEPTRRRLRFRPAQSFLRPWRLLRSLERRAMPGPRIALISTSGSIVDSDDEQVGSGRIAWRPLQGLLHHVASDPRVRAVVLRIDSPGGSGLASDLIWHELRQLRERKPLVASMGSVAASGGYYLAMAADHVLADPLTITGSIGVVAGKFEVQGLLDKVRVRREVLSYGAHSGMFSSTSGWSPGERERLRAQLLSFYDAFVDKAALGRGRPRDELERHARGRIWTGGQAKERGLVDSVGGVRDALREAARRAGLGTAWETWVYAPPHPGLLERLMRLAPTVGGSRAAARAGGDQTLVQARLPVEIRIR